MEILIGWLVNALALYFTDFLIPGISVDNWQTLLVSALVIGVINALLKPILQLISLPITILTLGIFSLVINAALLGLAASIVPGFRIDGFLSAFLGTIVLSIVSTILHSFVKPKNRIEQT